MLYYEYAPWYYKTPLAFGVASLHTLFLIKDFVEHEIENKMSSCSNCYFQFATHVAMPFLYHYLSTDRTLNVVEKFLTDNVKIPVGNTDIQFTGGATSLGIQWSSDDSTPTEANLTGNSESESST